MKQHIDIQAVRDMLKNEPMWRDYKSQDDRLSAPLFPQAFLKIGQSNCRCLQLTRRHCTEIVN